MDEEKERRVHERRRLACLVSDDMRCKLAEDSAKIAADKAVKKCFAIMGVDVEDPHDIENFRQGLRFGSMLHAAAKRGFIALISTVIGALGLAVWLGLKELLGKSS